MTIRRLNPKKQGELGFAFAINWFTQRGYVVSIPLLDSQRYDLIVDDDEKLQRVQVKTTTFKSRHGRFVVNLRTMGGNRSGQTIKYFNPDEVELVFVLADDDCAYLIPSGDLASKNSLSLGSNADRYRVHGSRESIYSIDSSRVGTQVANEEWL